MRLIPHLIIAACTVLSLSLTAQVFNPANGHVYIVSGVNETFAQARAFAASVGGYLVAINDQAEMNFLRSRFPMNAPVRRYWIGLSDEASEGHFLWDSGEPLTYTNWCAGEPNNWLGAENAVEWYRGPAACGDGWNDHPGTLVAGGPTQGIVELAPVRNPANGHGYLVTPSTSVLTARTIATLVGGHLVTVNDFAEHTFIVNTFTAYSTLWIGLSDEAIEGTFAWDNGDALTFSRWCTNEPSYLASEDYVQLVRSASGCANAWRDVNPSFQSIGLIELPFTLMPSAPLGPGSLAIDNHFGRAGYRYLNAFAFAPGAYPNGWLFGIDIGVPDLLTEIGFGAPFYGTLDGSGRSSFFLPAGIPAGLPLYGVGIEIHPQTGLPVEASRPVLFTTP